MTRKPKATRTSRAQPSRSKLDPRLALLLSLPDKQLRALNAAEQTRIAALAKEFKAAAAGLARAKDRDRDSASERLRKLDGQLFAPLTVGLSIPSPGRGKPSTF